MASKLLPGKEARLKAQRIFGRAKQNEIEVLSEKSKALATARSKTERLRSLRLAKEAADKEAAKKTPPKKRPARQVPNDD
jgi:hypothetical protein